jgi:serine/threonine-protein kinase
MGEVYRARDTRLGRAVAIKILRGQYSGRFQREAKAISALNHPNICTLHDVGADYLVMELVEGVTLAERIAEGALPLDEALAIARQIGVALEAAHERGIVHRDLKPANIKIQPDGTVKVLDFGLAKMAAASAVQSGEATQTLTLTVAGTVMGTPSYMAPEQAHGKPADKRADIWAFGVLLYEMLAGRRPFRGESTQDILAAVLTREPDWSAVPPRTARLLRRCLERDVRKRLRDIGDFPLLLEDGPPVASSTPWRGKIALAGLAAITVVLALLLWRAPRDQPHRLMRFDASPGQYELAGQNAIALSPDGNRLAYVVRPQGGAAQLATRTLDEAAPTLLAGTEGADSPFFSPDGQWIGFATGRKMEKISVHGGPAAQLCDVQSPRGTSWGPNSYIVANLMLGGGLFRVPDGGGVPQQLTDPAKTREATHRWPQILPGGEAVLFTGHFITDNYDDANIEVLSLKTCKWNIVQRGGYFGRYVPTGHLLFVRHFTLYAAPFDLNRLEVSGAAAPLFGNVAGMTGNGAGNFDASNGTLVYVDTAGRQVNWPVVWVDRDGLQRTIPIDPGSYSAPASPLTASGSLSP